jgi:uncharacterized protein YdhG (YjbR/CyaY superfamily)
MVRSDFTSVDEYIASKPETTRAVLISVRNAIRQALREADESISYKMPTYKVKGRPVLYFAGWARHFSIYPATRTLVVAFKDELAPYEVNKGTIRFPLSGAPPVELIKNIAKFRAKEIGEQPTA